MNEDSKIFGISLRGLITIVIVLTVCYMSIRIMKVDEPLYTLCMICVGFYFGQARRTEKGDVNVKESNESIVISKPSNASVSIKSDSAGSPDGGSSTIEKPNN